MSFYRAASDVFEGSGDTALLVSTLERSGDLDGPVEGAPFCGLPAGDVAPPANRWSRAFKAIALYTITLRYVMVNAEVFLRTVSAQLRRVRHQVPVGSLRTRCPIQHGE